MLLSLVKLKHLRSKDNNVSTLLYRCVRACSLFLIGVFSYFLCTYASAQTFNISMVDSSGALFLEGKNFYSPGDLVSIKINGQSLDILVTDLYCLIPPGKCYLSSESFSLMANMASFADIVGVGAKKYDSNGYVSYDIPENLTVDIDLVKANYDPVIAGEHSLYRSKRRKDYGKDLLQNNLYI